MNNHKAMLFMAVFLGICTFSCSNQPPQDLAPNVQLSCSSADLDSTATASCQDCTFTVPQNVIGCHYSCTCKVIQATVPNQTNNATYDATNNDCSPGTQNLQLGIGMDGSLHCVGSGNTAAELIASNNDNKPAAGYCSNWEGFFTRSASSLITDFGLPCSLFSPQNNIAAYNIYAYDCSQGDSCSTWEDPCPTQGGPIDIPQCVNT